MKSFARHTDRSAAAHLPDYRAVEAAQARLAGHVVETPVLADDKLAALCGASVLHKMEAWQHTGAFKLRGALNRMLQLSAAERARGVITMSTGNHGRAVAYAARALGVQAVVCMGALVPENKRAAIAALGAEIVMAGNSQDEAAAAAAARVEKDGLVYIPPFDDPDIIAGQGTVGLEIAHSVPDVACVLVPLSGGGLLAGVALALKERCPNVRIIGISTAQCPAMVRSLEAGHPVTVAEQPSVADSLGGGIGLENRYSFALVRGLVDDVVVLDEDDIKAGMRHLFLTQGIVSEGAGAVGAAALLAGKVADINGPVVSIVSGRNVDMDGFLRIMNG